MLLANRNAGRNGPSLFLASRKAFREVLYKFFQHQLHIQTVIMDKLILILLSASSFRKPNMLPMDTSSVPRL